MAEIKNNFVKSKMNKDLDDRLLSNGEYRNAQNVNINRSEGEDVGALENVLGNKLLGNLPNTSANLEVIGFLEDSVNNRAFFMVTNYSDTSKDRISNVAPYNSLHYIVMVSLSSNSIRVLVEGYFLNFSKTHPIFGLNLIEDLLFFSDGRNQPRKINVTKAIASSTYYTKEDQISVAKYYPYNAPLLWDSVTATGLTRQSDNVTYVSSQDTANLRAGMNLEGTTTYIKTVKYTSPYNIVLTAAGPNVSSLTFVSTESKDVKNQYLKPSVFGRANITGTTTTLIVQDMTDDPYRYMRVYNKNNNYAEITGLTWTPGSTSGSLTISPALTVTSNDVLKFAWPNPEYISSWPGDKELMSDKFIRFAYRFKFDDNEYSLISPFTQPAFIPKQNGYIITDPPVNTNDQITQEDYIANSTILSFFENKVNQVLLRIQMPYVVNTLEDNLKVSDIEILYKESDGLAIQVLETIPVTDPSITGNSTNYYNYTYQSRKPIRTLPERETTRVFDKVPVRAFSQSIVGNRVVYGNFADKHTPPNNLDYSVTISEKLRTQADSGLAPVTGGYTSNCRMSYPIHTVKQNRNYQVGVVLADRYGRQSDVILSSLNNFQQELDSIAYDASTIFHQYKSEGFNPATWFGDSLKIMFANKIPSTVSYADGYPGLYQPQTTTATVIANISATQFELSSIPLGLEVGSIINMPTSSGTIITSVIAISGNNITIADENSSPATTNYDITIYLDENKLGWYSYKIVVKDQAEDYYNAFLGNISQIPSNAKMRAGGTIANLNGSFCTTLISDNINKIPADLNEVGPEQTQFGTSDAELNPRVGRISLTGTDARQIYVDTETASIDAYGKIVDLGLNDNASGSDVSATGMFEAGGNPNSIILSIPDKVIGGTEATARVFSVVEVKPRTSLLNIYWETSTSGLISELNQQIEDGNNVTPIAPDPLPEPTTTI